jgi:type I restriction enzyme, S subunit
MTNLKEKQNIPSGWRKTSLESLATKLKMGGTPTSTNKSFYGGVIPFVKIDDMTTSGKYLSSTLNFISDDGLKNSSAWLIPKDSILYSIYATVGEVSINKIDVATNQAIMGIVVNKKEADQDYLYQYLISIKPGLKKYFKETTQKNLTSQIVKELEIFIPRSIKEQQKIAEILGAVDEDIAKTQEVIEATEKLKRGLMQQLFTRGIGHTKFKEAKIGQIPKEWNDAIMRDVCRVRQGLQIPISKRLKEAGENRYLYITIKYLRDAHLPDVAEYIENPQKSVICNADDILMTRTGNTGRVITGVGGVFHNNFFMVDYDRKIIDKDFLVYYLNNYSIQEMIKVRAGSTTIPDLNHGDFYSLPIAIPKKSEQRKIAEILSAVDEKILVNKKLKEELTLLKKGLMQDLLSGKVRTST